MQKVWFKRKSFGWGWVPVSWQGWVVTLLYCILMPGIFIHIDAGSHSDSDTLIAFAIPFIILTSILIAICYAKGEKPKWQWGNDKVH